MFGKTHEITMKKIAVIGVGYVGLVTATCFAEVGYHVICLDIDQHKIAMLRNGSIPIFEPNLEDMVKNNIAAGRLQFTTDYQEALRETSVAMVAVDTPTGKDGRCDLRSIEKASISIGQSMVRNMTVVIKSTVPVGTSSFVASTIQNSLKDASLSVDLVSNPEFLREGCAVYDFMHPDRVIVGVSSERAEEVMRDLYRPFRYSEDKFVVMDTTSSELTKYAANTMLACRISFMNWMSRLCEKTNADIEAVRVGIGSDKRIGPAFLHAGAGFGGSCFPKDIKALRGMAKEYEIPSMLIDAIDETNEEQKHVLGQKIIAHFQEEGGLKGKVIAILGLSFKPDTDDMREAPSCVLIEQLLYHKAILKVFDPIAMENAKKVLPQSSQIIYCNDEYDAAKDAHAIVLITEWAQFRKLDFKKIRSLMSGNLFFDGRNQFPPEELSRRGFSYVCIGRPQFSMTPHIESMAEVCSKEVSK
jgi:UDPglucose 6-dehydrogenase